MVHQPNAVEDTVDEDARLHRGPPLAFSGDLSKMRGFRTQVEVTKELVVGVDELEVLFLQVRGAETTGVCSAEDRPFDTPTSIPAGQQRHIEI